MTAILECRHLSKSYGRLRAVDDFTVTVESGEILGFVGPNGAGKSTALKMIATILKPSSGDALVCGYSVRRDPQEVRRRIGYMPDVCGLYESLTVVEYLNFFASVYKIYGDARDKIVHQVLEITGLESKSSSRCGALSRGMSQRLHLARVLIHDPDLLLLDEPASGLDPRARVELRELLMTLKEMGKSIIISSHILSELGEMCDTVAMIETSKLVYVGHVDDAARDMVHEGKVYRLKLSKTVAATETPTGSRADLVELLKGIPGVDGVREGEDGQTLFLRLLSNEACPHAILKTLLDRGFPVEEFSSERLGLEDAFLHLTTGKVQ